MSEVKKQTKIITPKFRMSFPALFVPKPFEDGGEPVYSLTCLFPVGCDLKALQGFVLEAMTEKWGDKALADFKAGKIRNPFRKQDEKEHLAGYEAGGYFIILRSKNKPGVVGPDVQPVTDPAVAYAGRWARASLSVFAWSHAKGGRGVSFGLNNVQLLEEADRFGGGAARPSEDFEPVAIPVDAEVPANAAAALFG